MKTISSKILILLIMSFGIIAWAKSNGQHSQKEPTEPALNQPKLYFYDDTPTSGMVHRDRLLNALKHPLVVKDQEGKTYPVVFYQYLYARLDIFEDEYGAVILVPEYFNTYSKDGLLPPYHLEQFDQFAGFGDTLIIEDVRFLMADSSLSKQTIQGLKIFVDD